MYADPKTLFANLPSFQVQTLHQSFFDVPGFENVHDDYTDNDYSFPSPLTDKTWTKSLLTGNQLDNPLSTIDWLTLLAEQGDDAIVQSFGNVANVPMYWTPWSFGSQWYGTGFGGLFPITDDNSSWNPGNFGRKHFIPKSPKFLIITDNLGTGSATPFYQANQAAFAAAGICVVIADRAGIDIHVRRPPTYLTPMFNMGEIVSFKVYDFSNDPATLMDINNATLTCLPDTFVGGYALQLYVGGVGTAGPTDGFYTALDGTNIDALQQQSMSSLIARDIAQVMLGDPKFQKIRREFWVNESGTVGYEANTAAAVTDFESVLSGIGANIHSVTSPDSGLTYLGLPSSGELAAIINDFFEMTVI